MAREAEARTLTCIAVAFALLSLPAVGALPVVDSGSGAAGARSAEPRYDLILVLDEGFEREARAAVDALGGEGRIDLRTLPISRVVLGAEGLARLHAVPHVVSVEPNLPLRLLLDESVPAVGAPIVWETSGERGAGSTVLVIDSGVDSTHPDLREALVDLGGSIVDTAGHGTHVASTILGRGNVPLPGDDPGAGLAKRYRGVAPEARLASFGIGAGVLVIGALQGFDYALQKKDQLGIRVISNSWGPDCTGPTGGAWGCSSAAGSVAMDAVGVAARKAYEAGMVVVFAAGNDGPDPDRMNPYSLPPWVLSVAATTKSRLLADFSSRGQDAGSRLTHNHPDIAAPGVAILAGKSSQGWMAAEGPLYCGAGQEGSTADPSKVLAGQSLSTVAAEATFYQCLSGTSMATPHVSGVAALVASANPALSPDQVMDILGRSVDALPRGYWEAGAGFVNAARAVELARTTPGELASFLAGARKHSGGEINKGGGDFARDSTSEQWYTTRPYVGFVSPPGGVVPPGGEGVELLVEGLSGHAAATVEASLDGGGFKVLMHVAPDRYRFTGSAQGLAEGEHALAMRIATDAGGAAQAAATFLFDRHPSCRIVVPGSSEKLAGEVPFTVQSVGAGSAPAVQLFVDDAPSGALSGPDANGNYSGLVETWPLRDGDHRFAARCTDADGLTRTDARVHAVANGNGVRIVAPATASTVSGSVNVRVQVTAPSPEAVLLSVDSSPEVALLPEADGVHFSGSWDSTAHANEPQSAVLVARATFAGADPRSSGPVAVAVDNKPDPSVEIVAPENGQFVAGTTRIRVRAASALAEPLKVEVRISNSIWREITPNVDGEGNYYHDWDTQNAFYPSKIEARATDSGGARTAGINARPLGVFTALGVYSQAWDWGWCASRNPGTLLAACACPPPTQDQVCDRLGLGRG